MTDEQRRAWEYQVKTSRLTAQLGEDISLDLLILAADAELTALRAEVERLNNQLVSTRRDLHEGFKVTSKISEENDALRAKVERLEESNKWYAEYANNKDRRVAEEIGRCNEAEIEVSRLRIENDQVHGANVQFVKELERLRDSVEWACSKAGRTNHQWDGAFDWKGFRRELRRRAGMEVEDGPT